MIQNNTLHLFLILLLYPKCMMSEFVTVFDQNWYRRILLQLRRNEKVWLRLRYLDATRHSLQSDIIICRKTLFYYTVQLSRKKPAHIYELVKTSHLFTDPTSCLWGVSLPFYGVSCLKPLAKLLRMPPPVFLFPTSPLRTEVSWLKQIVIYNWYFRPNEDDMGKWNLAALNVATYHGHKCWWPGDPRSQAINTMILTYIATVIWSIILTVKWQFFSNHKSIEWHITAICFNCTMLFSFMLIINKLAGKVSFHSSTYIFSCLCLPFVKQQVLQCVSVSPVNCLIPI